KPSGRLTPFEKQSMSHCPTINPSGYSGCRTPETLCSVISYITGLDTLRAVSLQQNLRAATSCLNRCPAPVWLLPCSKDSARQVLSSGRHQNWYTKSSRPCPSSRHPFFQVDC